MKASDEFFIHGTVRSKAEFHKQHWLTCCVEDYDDGLDESLDGNWYRYAPPTWTLSCGHTAEGDEAPSCCPTCGAKVVE